MLETLSILNYQSVTMFKWRQSAGKIAKAKPSQTIRRTPKGDDIVGTLQRCKEIDRNDQSARKSSNKMSTSHLVVNFLPPKATVTNTLIRWLPKNLAICWKHSNES